MDTAKCMICEKTLPAADIIRHLKDVHGQEVAPLTWPDGEPVIFDHALEPEDFG